MGRITAFPFLMRYLNPDGSKKFPFKASSLTSQGLREFSTELASIRRMREEGKSRGAPSRTEAVTKPQAKDPRQCRKESPRDVFLKTVRRDPEADFILYYIRVVWNRRKFYKIGITTTSLRKRFGDDYRKISKVLLEERVVGARAAEQRIISEFGEHLFPLALFREGNGFSEFFDRDVLGLDEISPR